MAFESLLNQALNEEEILQRIIREVQADYGANQNAAFYLKIEKADNGLSRVAWVKVFQTLDEHKDYYWDSEYWRACILVIFHDGNFRVLCNGFGMFDSFQFWQERVGKRRTSAGDPDLEKRPRAPRALVEGAFGELSTTVRSLKRPKAV